jgi:hypothetical protein
MTEFTSEEQKSFRPVIVIVSVAILLIAIVTAYFYARYQSAEHSTATTPGPVVIPGMVRSGDPDFEYYKNKIRIENVKASLGITFSKARIAIVSGVVSNEGDRKLEALELRITLYDVYDKLSKERVATPIRPGVGLKGPLEPLEKRTFSVGIESVEQLWNPRRLEVMITGLKYK